MTDQITPNSLACMPDQYEGDIDGFIDHLVDDHGFPADHVEKYRRAIDQTSWSVIANWHGAIMEGRFIPRHRRPGPADPPLLTMFDPGPPRHRA